MSTKSNIENTPEQIQADVQPQIEKMKTWNIIFIAVDINEGYALGKTVKNNEIQVGIDKFKKDVEETTFSEHLKIYMLEFKSDDLKEGTGKPVKLVATENNRNGCFTFKQKKGVNESQISSANKPVTLKIKEEKFYTNYFSSLDIKEHSKNMVIFLAHSSGATFLNNSFDITNLNNILLNGFKSVPIDCLLALNCTLQSIETNCILRNTVSLLIGSQQTLYPEAISYKSLFYDLANYFYDSTEPSITKGYNVEHIFSKFILDSHKQYVKSNLAYAYNTFNLTLTKPVNSKYLMFYLKLLGALMWANRIYLDKDIIHQAMLYCKDPDNDDTVSFLDARMFFEKIKDYFELYNYKIHVKLLDKIISKMKDLIVYHLADGNCCIQDNGLSGDSSLYIPHGLAIFLMKKNTDKSNEIEGLYEKILDWQADYLTESEFIILATEISDVSWITQSVDKYKLYKNEIISLVKSTEKRIKKML